MERQDLTVSEAAERLHVPPRTVRRLIRSGALKAINYRGRAGYRIPPEEIERFRSKEVAA